ncbi:MAG: hypothetical protein HJJLKODD_00955 [Phycisphaerae bacterium]|nr:hypothetical protein [Phycisphaerae bacterium]
MRTLNDMPDQWQEHSSTEWSVAKGVRNGLMATAVAALAAAGLLLLVTWQSPGSFIITGDDLEGGILRMFLGKVLLQVLVAAGLMRLLLGVMIRFSGGLTGGGTTILVVLLAVAILISKHPLLAVVGYDGGTGLVTGGHWLNPGVILMSNLCNWAGVGLGVVLFKDGSGVLEWLGYG